ncbi:LytTR family DNA-binding domain-containing protein [Marinoscillum sp. MHG1-6]|uniref:LytR/AlgR family response regulator transcription factor n=1 Tax=Marinoscillum sp. MHG1-6 TaxID=2959627 RepID=UPI0021577928|nr:LytTR family DNA-binding domain-containing protein [Marinoscillum sp. MHG1-6]
MLNIAIIEDEPLAAEDLAKTLNEISDDSKVVVKLDSVRASVEWLSHNDVDLILSDIELGDGLSFDIFSQVKKNIPIVLTTAYDQYAIRAFKENSIDYLLKPIDRDELKAALDKYRSWATDKKTFDVDSVLSALKQQSSSAAYQERFLVTLGERLTSIPENRVAYFFSEDRYTFLVTKEGSQHIINYNLGDLEDAINPAKFFRINRKFIISFEAIKNMVAYSKSRVKIDLDPSAPKELDVIVSVERSGPFKKWLNR